MARAHRKKVRQAKRGAGDAVEKEMLAFLASDSIEVNADYVRRGRAHQGLSEAVLINGWKAAFQRYARRPTDAGLRREEGDLRSELELRGIKAPFGTVSDAYAEFLSNARRVYHELTADPERLRSAKESLERDLDQFFAKRRAGN